MSPRALTAGVHESMQPFSDKINDLKIEWNKGNLTLWEENFIRLVEVKINQGQVLDKWHINHIISMHEMRVVEGCPAKKTEIGRRMGYVPPSALKP